MSAAELSPATCEALRVAGLRPDDVRRVVLTALDEDGAGNDLTSLATVSERSLTDGRYVARAAGVAAGIPVLAAVVELGVGSAGVLRPMVRDGDRLQAGDTLAEVSAPSRALLGIERTSLNLLGHLSGIASLTARWVEAVDGTSARIRDTRKTMPGLRNLEKYAVRCGGGVNHRRGLDDAVLIKDNHVAAAGGVGEALDRVRARHAPGSVVVQVEVDDLEQLDQALDHEAPQILLDNFELDDMRRAVDRVRQRSPQTLIEASGGLSLERAAAVAATGVDFLAVGALTHSAPALDIGLDT